MSREIQSLDSNALKEHSFIKKTQLDFDDNLNAVITAESTKKSNTPSSPAPSPPTANPTKVKRNAFPKFNAEKLFSGKNSFWLENFLSGASASLLSKLILQPFDTTRTILQASPSIRGDYNNLGDCLVGMARRHGFLSLYRGFMGSIIVSAPSSAIFFSAYEYFTNTITAMSSNPQIPLSVPSPLIPLLSSSLGNVVSSAVRSPPEIVKQRVQAGFYDNMLTATVSMLRNEGILSFFKGYFAMISRDIPYAGTQFTVFEFLKKRRNRIQMRKQRSKTINGVKNMNSNNDKLAELSNHEVLLSNLWIGAFAGLCASVLTSPIDVVKTRVMTQHVLNGGVSLNMQQMFMRVWAEEGIGGFGRGLAPRVLYKVPSSAVFLVCYEGSKHLFNKIRESQHRNASQTGSGQRAQV